MKSKLLVFLLPFSLVFIVTTNASFDQVFKNIKSNFNNFPKVSNELSLSFPKDHGKHEDFQIEWWYLTANLKDEFGNSKGLQWTLFRLALEENTNSTGWENSQIWMGHAAVTDNKSHFFSEKFARGGVGQANVIADPFSAWIDDWKLQGDTWKKLTVSAHGDEFKYNLDLSSFGPIIKHGNSGFSLKSSNGHASAYYSQPSFQATGWIEINGTHHYVTGTAWIDHEWSSQFLAKNISGWNWFSLNFTSGDKLMLFRVKEKPETFFYSGTWIYSDGSHRQIEAKDIILQPKETTLPEKSPQTVWNIKIKSLGVDISTNPINQNAYMNTVFPYWEGPITSQGTHEGLGYLEITGF